MWHSSGVGAPGETSCRVAEQFVFMKVFVGSNASIAEPARVQHWRRHMSGIIQRYAGKRIARWMSRAHTVRVHGLRIFVPVGVFPPKFFFSTRLLCDTLRSAPVQGRSLLEVGSGSGAVSLTAAKAGAKVTAVDISVAAVAATGLNATANRLDVRFMRSDLFAAVGDEKFDFVVVNPPYFQHDPASELDHAFHAGSNFEYFHRLFANLGKHVAKDGVVLLTLAEGCDGTIADIAAVYGWKFRLDNRRMSQLQWTYLFSLHR